MTTTPPVTPADEIVAAAQHLLDVLNETVPTTTIHYAVETIRVDLVNLIRLAPGIKTNPTPTESQTATYRAVAALIPGATVEHENDGQGNFVSLEGPIRDDTGNAAFHGPFAYVDLGEYPTGVWTVEFRHSDRLYQVSNLTVDAPAADVARWIRRVTS